MNLNSNCIILKLLFAIFLIALLNALLLNNGIGAKFENSESIKVFSSLSKRDAISKQSQTQSNFSLNPIDLMTLLNITNFRFILNHPNKCNELKNIFMLIFVHSGINNFAKRETIRRTWGNMDNFRHNYNSIRLIFLVGQTNDLNLTSAIENENEHYGDIVQGNFVDSYRNMTYKHIMGLKWVSYFCPNVPYIFKADDDIFVDLFQLIYYLKGSFGGSPHNLIACYLNKGAWAKRSYRNKWRVSYKEYSNNYYPQYCSGWVIIMSRDVAAHLYSISRNRTYFWIDDVFVSGILAQDLNIDHKDMTDRISVDISHVNNWLESDHLTLPPMFGSPNIDTEIIKKLWNKTVQYYHVKLNYTLE